MTAARRLLVIFALGGLLGTLFDYIHVYFGVLSYEQPDFAGTKLAFVPVEFGVAGVIGALAAWRLAARFKAPKISPGRAAFDAALLAVAYVCTGVFLERNGLTFLALVPLVALSVGTRPSRYVLVASLFAALVGPVSESLVSAAGFFHYNYAHPVPVWLPLLWIVAAGSFIDFSLLLHPQNKTAGSSS